MDEENLEAVRSVLNQWWNDENIPTEQLRARVVSFFQKRRHKQI